MNIKKQGDHSHIRPQKTSMVIFFSRNIHTHKTACMRRFCTLFQLASFVIAAKQQRFADCMAPQISLKTNSAHFCFEAFSWCLRVEKKSKLKWERNDWKLSRDPSWCMLPVRTRLAKAGSVLRCGCGAVTGQCPPGRSGSFPATCRRGKPPPPDEPLRRGSPPPAAGDWPPDERSHNHLQWHDGASYRAIHLFIDTKLSLKWATQKQKVQTASGNILCFNDSFTTCHSVPDGTPFLLNLSVFKPQWMEEQENTPGLKIKNKKVSL